MQRQPIRNLILLPLTFAVLGGCAMLQPDDRAEERQERSASAVELAERAIEDPSRRISDGVPVTDDDPDAEEDTPSADLYPGTGRLFDVDAIEDAQRLPEGDIALNFEEADVREVVASVMEDILGENYTMASNVSGRITLQTTRPLQERAVLPTLERVLHMNGIALVHDRDADLWRIMRVEDAQRAGYRLRLGRSGAEVPPGYQVAVVPLEFIAASEMEKLLEPLLSPGAQVRVDRTRNLLMVTAGARDMEAVEEAAAMFDVDLLEGMSVGLFPMENVDPVVLAEELGELFGADAEGPMAGMFRFIPIQRLGSVMVVTPQAEYLREAETWIERLDRARGDARGRSIYVYRMQNADAEVVADVLNRLYDMEVDTGTDARDRLDRRDEGPGRLAPGEAPTTLGDSSSGDDSGNGDDAGLSDPPSNSGGPDSSPGASAFGGGSGSGNGNDSDNGDEDALGNVRVVADTTNNALLIFASASDYDRLKKVIEELDIEPLQVLVDATIVEVTLSDELRFGLQWMFRDGFNGYSGEGVLGTSSELSRRFPGFNYSVVDAGGDVRGVLNALAEDERVNVLSSPSLMVLDNRTAHLRVGDQVPIRTGETVSAVTDGVVTSSISFRDTGVLLSVTPRVNAGGMVTMEVIQEVSDVSSTESSDIDSPTISTRDIQSTVAVQSGETIVLGGLIRENQRSSETGVPLLKDMPLLGGLFRQSVEESRRTELIVMLTPRVAGDRESARAITDEFRQRLDGLEESFREWRIPGHQPLPEVE